jgi:cathepsin L
LALWSNYPYQAQARKCNSTALKIKNSPAYLTGYKYVKAGDVAAIMKAVDEGVVSAALYSECPEFRFYNGAIIQDSTGACATQGVDHAINIVGYGTESGIDYWLVRNSWDTIWGDAGYAKIERGKNVLRLETHVAQIQIQLAK